MTAETLVARLEARGLDRTPTYGALKEESEVWLTRLLRRCITAGWVDFEGGDRPVVVLTQEGAQVMRAERPVRVHVLAAGFGHCRSQLAVSQTDHRDGEAPDHERDEGAERTCGLYPEAGHEHPAPTDHRAKG